MKIAEDDDTLIEFRLIDRGSGINPEVDDTLFEPFISTKDSVGVGMGLTLASHLLRSLGGELKLQANSDGPGVTAFFIHPLN